MESHGEIAQFIAKRFNINYPQYKGEFARVITYNTNYAQSLIEDFSQKDKMPHIAISVDMLDTGIDVPEIVNLVLFKQVWSKTKFMQMLGHGTRLYPDLFGPGEDKKEFYVFDFCQNLEYFKQNPEGTDGSLGDSLSKRLFKRRLELITVLDERLKQAASADLLADFEETYADPKTEAELRGSLSEILRTEVAAMNVDNFVVRPKRLWVERFSKPESWKSLPLESLIDLHREVAGLPSELESDGEEAKRFDLLILNLQLALLNTEPAFERLAKQLRQIAGLLELKSAIPIVREQMPLIQGLQSDEWWEDVNCPMLDVVRRRLRLLVRLIDKKERLIVYTDFDDEIGEVTEIPLLDFTVAEQWEQFRAKVQSFLRAHQELTAVQKLRHNVPLNATDLAELERILIENAAVRAEELRQAEAETEHGLGLFFRSLVGLDRDVAKNAFAHFIANNPLTANQMEFVNLVIDHLAENGLMEHEDFYDSPFVDVAATGPESLFRPDQVETLIQILAAVRSTATAAVV